VTEPAPEAGGRGVTATLAGLLALDVVLATVAFGFPELWFQVFHGVPYQDPEGFLRRCAANWAAFALLQAIALRRWRREPWWLLVVAGARLSDIFTDWTYLFFAHDVTWFARASLATTSPGNLVVGIFLVKRWRERCGSVAPCEPSP
jgi:hypothetical protein